MSVASQRLLSSSSMAKFLLRTLFVSFQIIRCLLTLAKCINKDYLAERDFMLSLPDESQADAIETFNSTTRYLDHLLNTDTVCFEQMVDQIYYIELQFNGAKSSQFYHQHFECLLYLIKKPEKQNFLERNIETYF